MLHAKDHENKVRENKTTDSKIRPNTGFFVILRKTAGIPGFSNPGVNYSGFHTPSSSLFVQFVFVLFKSVYCYIEKEM